MEHARPSPDAGAIACTLWLYCAVGCAGQSSMTQASRHGWTIRAPVPSARVTPPAETTMLGLGAGHGCELLPSGTVRCWGDNSQDQLGRGYSPIRARPVPLEAPEPLVSLEAGGLMTCGRTREGRVFCW